MNKTYIIKIKMFLQKLLISLLLVGLGVVATVGTMSYMWLKADNARLMEEKAQLEAYKSTLEQMLDEAEAETNLLKGNGLVR